MGTQLETRFVGSQGLAITAASPPRSQTLAQRFRRRFMRHKLGMFGLAVLLLLVLMAIFAPWVAGHDPYETNLMQRNEPPSAEHLLGTDAIGRDGWARLVYGARVSLAVGVVAVGIHVIIGVTVGSIAGYIGGRIDDIIMRFTDLMMCFPTLLLIITAAAALPPNILNVMAIIGIFGWAPMCRLVRGQILSLRNQDYILAAKITGAKQHRIIIQHLLPNALGPVIVAATLGLASAILTEASLSFLGFGVQEPVPSWGATLQVAMQIPVLDSMPWRWVPAAVMIALTVLAVNFMGDGLRDAVDPRMSLD